MGVHKPAVVGRDVDLLVLDHVLDDNGSGDRRGAENIDPGRAWSCRVFSIRAVARNVVAGDQVVVEVLPGIGGVQVEGYARQAIADQPVADYDVAGGLQARRGDEEADAGTRSLNVKSITGNSLSEIVL